MRTLVDSHTMVWALDNPARLSNAAVEVVENAGNRLTVSAGTIWKISIKTGLGKLVLSLPFREWIDKAISDLGLDILPITPEFAHRQATLPFHHRDPFDRLLCAQCLVEDIPLVSADAVFDQYGVRRIWK